MVWKQRWTCVKLAYCEDFTIIELSDDETRLLYNVLLEQAQEHYRYASTPEVAERLYRLATRFGRPFREPHMTVA
jgi:hypothetical protein